MTKFAHIGSVIEGKPHNRDLLPAFADLLESLLREENHPGNSIVLGEIVQAARSVDPESETADAVRDDILEALNCYAPDYFYFGEQRNSNYGYWLCPSWREMMEESGVVLLAAGSPNPPIGTHVAFITDHGNISYGHIGVTGKFMEIWSIV